MVIFRCYSNPKIQYSIGICHEWGIIRDMKWCPSGTSDSFEVSLEDVSGCGLMRGCGLKYSFYRIIFQGWDY